MALDVKVDQLGSVVEVTWTTDATDPAAGWNIERTVNPPGTPTVLGNVIGDNRIFLDQITTADSVNPGDVLEYAVKNGDTAETGTASITWQDPTSAKWCSIQDVRDVLGDLSSSYTDVQIGAAIEKATGRLGSRFCREVVLDETTSLPVDVNVREATAVMAARILTAPAVGVPAVAGGVVKNERIGSYGYTIQAGTAPKSTHPMTIDSVIMDLVGPYVCPGVGGKPSSTDTFPGSTRTEPEYTSVVVS